MQKSQLHISGRSRDLSSDRSSSVEDHSKSRFKAPLLHSCKHPVAPDSDHDSSTFHDEDVEMAEETKGEDQDYSSYKEIERI